MFTVIAWRVIGGRIAAKFLCSLEVNSGDKAAELAQTLFQTLENVVVEIENKNGEVIHKLRKTS